MLSTPAVAMFNLYGKFHLHPELSYLNRILKMIFVDFHPSKIREEKRDFVGYFEPVNKKCRLRETDREQES